MGVLVEDARSRRGVAGCRHDAAEKDWLEDERCRPEASLDVAIDDREREEREGGETVVVEGDGGVRHGCGGSGGRR